jgi:general secretion pathway protein D
VRSLRETGRTWVAAALLATLPGSAVAQQTGTAGPTVAANKPNGSAAPVAVGPPHSGDHSKQVSLRDRKRAAQFYVRATKLFEEGRFEESLDLYGRAAALVPSNQDYMLAAEVARGHAVTALIQSAAKARIQGDSASVRTALERARKLDPGNPLVTQHLYELADAAIPETSQSLYESTSEQDAGAPRLQPTPGTQSFHLRTDRRQMLDKVFKAYGIDASIDQSVQGMQGRFDLDSATFDQALQALCMVTDTFWVPLDAHRVLVARDTRENRQLYQREELETVYLPGFATADMTEVSNIAKNVFAIQQISTQAGNGTMTVRAPAKTLDALNATLQDLVNAHSQVMLDVKMIQLARINQRNTGVQLPQQVTAFNVYAEEQSILNANQALVQQIISSGLAAPGDTLAILGILLASGQISSSIFSNGIALFGGGITLSGLSPGPATLNLNLNSSDSRELDDVQLRLADGQDQTIKSGSRYPILTASYSGLATSGVNIPGLTTAGTSSGLSSLLSSITGATTQIPQVQYQDLGLTLKANPKIMRNGDVALTLDLKITALAGSALNGIPLLNNRSYSGVITLKEGSGAVLASELDKQESTALSGTPGLTEIPGLNNVTSKDVQTNYATLLIVLTPHLIEAPQHAGRGPMIVVERGNLAQ